MQRYYEQFERCREHDIPFCADACPFHLDVLDFQAKMAKARFNAGYKTYRNAVVFPEIVSRLCPGYCKLSCPRAIADAPVALDLLEKACVAKATRKDAVAYNVPKKNARICIIGGGISGLGCALRLASKKYDVTLFEKTSRTGGHLYDILPEDIISEELARQFALEKYALYTDTEITDISSLVSDYDFIYIATGKDGNTFGIDDYSIVDNTGILTGGSLHQEDTVLALAEGLNAARTAEVFIMTGKLEKIGFEPSSLVVANEDKLKVTADPVFPSDGELYTDEEVVAEASRCIRCQCDNCHTYCDLVGYFNKWPIRMRDEILLTCKPSHSMIHKNPAMRLINTCTQCGMCKETCPSDIDLADMIKSARRKLHTLNKTPGAFRQYFLNDMEFANGKFAAIKKNPPGKISSEYAFFPGCQLGALEPDYVIKTYEWLLDHNENTGLLLRCCSVPVDWNGEEERHKEEIAKLKKDWEDMGKPVLILACMSCAKHLREYLPEIEQISLYEILRNWGFEKSTDDDTCYSIFDPCSARNCDSVQDAVRSLLSDIAVPFEELPKGDRHGCCGFGGNVSMATPEFAKYVADKRSELSDNPYVVYCSNCRDVFDDNNKDVKHILDILFDISPSEPTVTERRINRVSLKETLLDRIWGEKMTEKPSPCGYVLKMSDEVKDKINRQKLLEEDICHVIAYADETGRRTYSPEKDCYKAYKEIGHITCWVEYRRTDNEYEILNVYSHRMRIELEAVFNGRKIDM